MFIRPNQALLSLLQGSASALQFTGLNSLVYADIPGPEASRTSRIGSTAQQLSMSFGIAAASLVAGYFLGSIPQVHSPAFISALHHHVPFCGRFPRPRRQ